MSMNRPKLLALAAIPLFLCASLCTAGAPDATAAPPEKVAPAKLKCDAQIKVKPYQLVRIKAEGIDPKAGIVWRVTPSKDVSRATTPRGVLEFVAPPGLYVVDILVIKTGADGGIEIEEQSITVEIESCCEKVPPVPPKPKEKDPPAPKKPDAVQALGRIQFGNAGCTATVIGPRRADGKWDVLTAAHCVTNVGVGAKGSMKLKDGRTIAVKVANIHEGPDCSWLVTEDATLADLAFAEIAAANPAPGTKMWHRGYGVDKPDNREDGTVTVGENGDGQIEMSISVSSGDSGGGMFRDDTDELIAVVCCTTAKGQRARVWGCSAEVARKLRPKGASEELEAGWTPVEIPKRELDETAEFKWAPVEVPVRALAGPRILAPLLGRNLWGD